MINKNKWNTLRKCIKNNPDLLKNPLYKPDGPDSYSQSFENALLMVAKKNHANPRRFNLEDKFDMDGVIENLDGKPIFYYDAEYSNYTLVDENNKMKFWDIHVPIEKVSYFKKYRKSVYVRGNLEKIIVLMGNQVVDAFNREKIAWNKLTAIGPRDFISVNVNHAYSQNALKSGDLKSWMIYVKELMGLDYFWC